MQPREVILALRARVANKVSNNVSAEDAVAVCFAAALPRDRAELLGVILSKPRAAEALRHADHLAITTKEWVVLLGRCLLYTSPSPRDS